VGSLFTEWACRAIGEVLGTRIRAARQQNVLFGAASKRLLSGGRGGGETGGGVGSDFHKSKKQINNKQIAIQEEDLRGKLDPDDKFPPTDQQQAIVEALFTGGDIVVRAAAGTGKTSTLQILARRVKKGKPDRYTALWGALGRERIVYIAFNASVAAEARAKMPFNVEVRTADAISYNWVKLNYPKLMKKKGAKRTIYRNMQIAEHLSAPQPAAESVKEIRKAIYNFTISADKEIGAKHFDTDTMALGLNWKETGSEKPATGTEIKNDLLAAALQEKVDFKKEEWDEFQVADLSSDSYIKAGHRYFKPALRGTLRAVTVVEIVAAAQRWWEDIIDEKGLLPFDFNHMKKIWALSDPDLSVEGGGLTTPASIIFMDEAQDINPVLGRVIAAQKVQKVYVGDENQAIYQFMGAEDELQKLEVQHDLPLTKSFRFGEIIANNANRFLRFKERFLGSKTTFSIEGAGKVPGTIIPRGKMIDADAVLVRSNAGAFREIRTELQNGRMVGVTKAFKDDLDNFIAAVTWLQAPEQTRGTRPRQVAEEVRQYTTWQQVRDEAALLSDHIRRVRRGAYHRMVDDEAALESDYHSRGRRSSELSPKTHLLVKDVEELGLEQLKLMTSLVKVIKGAGDKKDIDTGALPDLPSDLSVGVEGEVGRGITFSVEEDAIVLRGKTFDVKDQIKTANGGPAKYNGDRKVWMIPAKTDQARLSGLQKLQKIIEPTDSREGPQKVDVVVSTVHQAKGLEWPKVRAGDDFFGPRKPHLAPPDAQWILPTEAEVNIAYIAVTRAQAELDMGSLDWIDKWVPANDPEILEKPSRS
jgi:hypothetical protein